MLALAVPGFLGCAIAMIVCRKGEIVMKHALELQLTQSSLPALLYMAAGWGPHGLPAATRVREGAGEGANSGRRPGRRRSCDTREEAPAERCDFSEPVGTGGAGSQDTGCAAAR